MKKVVKKITEKYLTTKTFNAFEDRFDKFENRFDSSARAVAKSFDDNAKVMALMLTEIREIHEDNKYFRQSISNLNIDGLSYDKKFAGLTERVEKLEAKSK